jgi:hypothetical protein
LLRIITKEKGADFRSPGTFPLEIGNQRTRLPSRDMTVFSVATAQRAVASGPLRNG